MIVRLANVVAKARQGKGWDGMEWNGMDAARRH